MSFSQKSLKRYTIFWAAYPFDVDVHDGAARMGAMNVAVRASNEVGSILNDLFLSSSITSVGFDLSCLRNECWWFQNSVSSSCALIVESLIFCVVRRTKYA